MPQSTLDRAAIERYRVDSSSIKAIGYQDGVCCVEFQNGHLFAYPMEPREFETFAQAESKGKYFNQSIRGKVKGEKLTSACGQCGSEPEIVGRLCSACGCETIKPMDNWHKP